ncbi:hypothetical protein [Leptospira biflexa]|uniref:hypothetical protein n=1 Tax=Leptospira biflexa TaxID=172 RepID=UPI00143842AE|nr:hypothetical protein [Leptospira biflexa]
MDFRIALFWNEKEFHWKNENLWITDDSRRNLNSVQNDKSQRMLVLVIEAVR